MKTFKQYLIESDLDLDAIKKLGKSLLGTWDDSKMTDFIKYHSYFPSSGKAPRGKKKEFEHLQHAKKGIDIYNEYGLVPMLATSFDSYYNEEDIDNQVDTFLGKTKKQKIEKIVIGNITFINNSSMAVSRFKSTSKTISALLKRLKGYHAKAIQKPLEIHFKYAKDMKSRAYYKSDLDQIWVKESSKADNELYGHLLYIIVHELGHRYEQFYKIPKGFKDIDFYTTKYSKVDGYSASETFAELFAVSFWEDKYPEYIDQIERFKKLM